VYLVKLRRALERDVPEAGAAVAAHWPSALLGSEAPDSHFFTEQTRPDLHALDQNDATTWAGAVERWLDQHPELSPGRAQPPQTVAFVVGYLSHIGLDTWAEQYLHDDFPVAAREGLPAAWYPPAMLDGARRRAALQRLAEEPVPHEYVVPLDAIARAPVPDGFRADPIRAITAGILPALAIDDAWGQSGVQPLPGRAVRSDTREERQKWEAERASRIPATDAEVAAVLDGALAFTLHMIRRWW
jgi:hypothetical protein